MFSVIISEKGGAERRETFDRTEINVGRVQGNELTLPKGNVSKRHARLLYRDGRFIVTDLKSTNGTYVNGRKIAQATIVREGDKIYIGDFVLRIEAGGGMGAVSSGAPVVSPLPDDVPSQGPSNAPSAPPAALAPAGPTAASLPNAAALMAAPMAGMPMPIPIPSPASFPVQPSYAPPPVGRSLESSDPKPSSLIEPPSSSQPSSAAERGLRPPSPRIEPKTGDRHEVISHFPLEHDPDESVHFAVPGPPRVPSSPRAVGGKTLPVPTGAPQAQVPARVASPPLAATPLAPTAQPGILPPGPAAQRPGASLHDASAPAAGSMPVDRATSPSMGLAHLLQDAGRSGAASIGPPRRPMPSSPFDLEVSPRPRPTGPPGPAAPTPPPAERAPLDPARASAHRAALQAVVDRVAELVDLRPLAGGAPAEDALAASVDRALRDAVARSSGQPELDLDELLLSARRELLEHGPLTALFDDEDVTEIQVMRHDHVVAMHGRRQVPSDLGFSGEAAVGRAIRRLCVASGKPLAEGEVFVERRLPRGGRLFAVLPRAEDHGHMVVIRKPQRADLTLEDLVRSGTISRAMAGLFTHCVAARANILVTGAVGAGTTTLIGALAGAGSTDDRVIVLQEDDELIFNQPHTISILLGDTPAEGARAVPAAARVRPDRLVVGAFSGPAAAELVDAMGDGVDGVIAGARAPTLRQAVLRLTADIAATKPGVVPEVAREWLTSVFDLAIEIARLRDGRHRVLRVSELAIEGSRVALRDIFTFAVERTAAGGAIEGSFHPTGVVPGIIEDLAARGVPVDPSIFRRHGKNDSIVTPGR